ncbi:MAG: ABC transporter permease [Deltaproteobacteria bacterium]|nr:ABC transporter permease [Deltaproteobacteria bacterium]
MGSAAADERIIGASSTLRNISVRKIVRAVRGAPSISILILLTFVFVGIFGSAIAPHDPTDADFENTLTPPFFQKGGTIKYPLGTDHLGRDSLSRLICGTRISLQVGFIVVALAGMLGTTIALLSGYLGGWVDMLLMRLTDTMMSMPYLMVAIVLAAVLGPSKNNIIIILAIIGWAGYARVLRGEVLRIKERDFVHLAITSGCSKFRIMLVHIFPNIVNTLVVLATLQLGIVIIAESALSFLGVGVPPPDPAWGLMIAEGRSYISNAWWLCMWPGLAILLVVLSCNLVGDWLRVRLDPKFRQL